MPLTAGVISHMNKTKLTDESTKKPLLVRAINFIVDNFLFISLFFLFIIIFKKIFGDSDIANIVGVILSLPLASIIFTIINKRFAGLMIFVLISAPAFVLAIVFLLM